MNAGRNPFPISPMAVTLALWFLGVPQLTHALTDSTGLTPDSALEADLERSFNSAHFEVFCNTPEDDLVKGVSQAEAERAAGFVECAWHLYMDPPLSGDHSFRRLRDLTGHWNTLDEEVQKIPVWIQAGKCCSRFNCSPDCLGLHHGATLNPGLRLSPL